MKPDDELMFTKHPITTLNHAKPVSGLRDWFGVARIFLG